MSSTNDQLRLQRQSSRAKITLTLLRHGPMTRARLADISGLSVACIGKVVNELVAGGELIETGNSTGKRGRPGSFCDINPDGPLAAGVLLSAGVVHVVIARRNTKIISRETISYRAEEDFRLTLEEVTDSIRRQIGNAAPLSGVGVSVAGLVDHQLGIIRYLTNRRGWEDVPVVKILQDALEVPVHADNNARSSALYVHWFGAGSEEGGTIYLYFGEGVGGAYIDDRGLMRGAHGDAGLFGHMTVEPDGPECVCGNRGCLNTLASDIAFIHSVWPDRAARASDLTFNERADMVREGIEKALGGDLQAARALASAARYIGIAVANIVAAMDPRTVYIYGSMTDIAQGHVMDMIRREALQRIWPDARGVEIKALTDYEDLLLHGAIGLVLSQPYGMLREQVHEVSSAR